MHVRFCSTVLYIAALLSVTACQQPGNDQQVLADLLDTFLAGATLGDADVHDQFWADELIYTSSSGERTTKAAIVASMRDSAAQRPAVPTVVYSAEDVDVRLHDDMAVVAFRLVGTPRNRTEPTRFYLNTGTFVKRRGSWKAIAWQVTAVPDREMTQ